MAASLEAALSAKDHLKVAINDSGHDPARIEVKVGEKIVGTNMSRKEHTVTSTDKLAKKSPEANDEEKPRFDSGPTKVGGTFERTFDRVGIFEHFCQMEKTMKGTITVRKAE
ncbi:MAG: hypothetical protein HY293_00585 [Planctomycetes bacterium]|nr:hypothetical protein [Planctomycetota bacterium]